VWYGGAKRIILSGKKEIIQILNDSSLLPEVLRISPKPKFQTATAYFLNSIDAEYVQKYISRLSAIDERKPISIHASRKGVVLNNTPVDWIKFTEVVDGFYHALNPNKKQQNTEPQAQFEEGKITVTKADNLQDACRLGAGTSWCIAKQQSGMFQSYRDMQGSTFYFVYDGTQPPDSPLRRVVVDMNKNGILLTDLNNTTGTIHQFGKETKPYFDYLASKGVDISQFVNKPYTEEERLESKKLGRTNGELNWFKQLTYDEKSKYIGRGHRLTMEQLAYLIHNNVNDLIVQYLNSGVALNPDEKAMISHKPQWLNTYLRARKIATDEIYKNADSLEEIVSIATVHREEDDEGREIENWDLPNEPDYDKLNELIDSGKATANEILATGYPYNIPPMLKWLIEEKGATKVDIQKVSRIASYDLNFAKMLVSKNIITPEQLMQQYTMSDDVFKWLVVEMGVPTSPKKAYNVAKSQDMDLIEAVLDSKAMSPDDLLPYSDGDLMRWLIEEKGATEVDKNIRAYFRDLPTLKYFVSRGLISIPQIVEVFKNMKSQNEVNVYQNVVKWLTLEHNIDVGDNTHYLATIDKDMAEWFIDSGKISVNELSPKVIHTPVLKWLIEEKGATEVNKRYVSLMAIRDTELANLLLNKGIVSPNEMANICANQENPNYNFINWLVTNYDATLNPSLIEQDIWLKRIVNRESLDSYIDNYLKFFGVSPMDKGQNQSTQPNTNPVNTVDKATLAQ